jgi:hypothetical protein
MSQRRNMPSSKSIYDYWHSIHADSELELHGLKLKIQYDLSGKRKLDCFACGTALNIERCHIKAKSEGGSDEKENLHLLCKSCHIESEMLSGDRYWIWFKKTIDKEWEPFTEHIHKKRLKLDFDELKLMEAYANGGLEAALNYMSFFEADNEEEKEKFKKEFRIKLQSYQNKLEKEKN